MSGMQSVVFILKGCERLAGGGASATPRCEANVGDLHPEGMLASSECLPIPRGWHPFRMQHSFVQPLPGVSLRSTPGQSLTSLQDEDLEHRHLLSSEDSPQKRMSQGFLMRLRNDVPQA